MDVPKFKKKINGFLLEEDGSVSKKTIISTGAAISLGVFGGVLVSSHNVSAEDSGKAIVCDAGNGTAETASNCYTHNNGASMGVEGGNLISAHQHHYNHGSHASHGSHGSHSSCCLAKGTKISMSDGAIKTIENVKIGDEVLVFDIESNTLSTSIVEELISPVKEHTYQINKGVLEITEDHPIRIKRDGEYYWAAIDVGSAKRAYKIEDMQKLNIGDRMIMLKENKVLSTEVTSIDIIKKEAKTYTFRVKEYHNYFANKILVHNMGMGGCDGMM